MNHPAPYEDSDAPLLAALDCFLARHQDRLGPRARHLAGDELEPVPFELWRRALLDPAREFLRRPGKELRGKLTALCFRGAGGRGVMARELPWVVELIHAGSLIVDDVQDDSAQRRGAPALHRMIGVPLAINTGNWLYFFALSLLEDLPLPAGARAALTREAIAALMSCHHGQSLDLSIDVRHLEPRHLPQTVATTTRYKTGALMGLAARLGAVAAGAAPERAEAIAHFGEELGVGLQMLDDLGSIAARARRDKGLEDLRGGRPTWPWAWLCAALDELAVARLQQRLRAAHSDDELEPVMTALREHSLAVGRAAVKQQLGRAFAEVAPHLESEIHHAMTEEIERLEASYG